MPVSSHAIPRPKNFYTQPSGFQITTVDIGNLEFSPGRGLDGMREFNNLVVVEIEAGDSIAGFRLCRLLLNRSGPALRIEFHNAVAFRIANSIGKHVAPFPRSADINFFERSWP